MPKFNEFIKSFEEKETAPKPQEPKVEPAPKTREPQSKPVAPKGNEQPKGTEPRENPVKYYKPLSKAEAEDMRKGGFTEDEYRYNQAKDYAIAMGEQIPDKNQYMKGLSDLKQANKQKVEAQPKPSKEPMPFGMKKRMEDEVSVHNGQQPKGGQQMPKKDYSYLDDRELYAQINLAENEEEYNDLLAEKERRWQESKKNQPQSPAEIASAHFGKQGSFEQVFGGEEEQEQEERAELFQKYRDMGYDKGDAQYKVQEVFNRRKNAKKEEEFEKLASVGSVFADNGEITINTPWSKNQRNNYKNYLELRSYLDEKYGQGNYTIDYLQDELRDNGRETSAKLKVILY